MRLLMSLLVLVCMALPAGAQVHERDDSLTEILAAGRPNAESGPTDVEIGLFVIDIRRIIDVEQTMQVDFLIEARWHDPRLALAEGESKGEVRRLAMDSVWQPFIQVVNLGRVFPQFPQRIIVNDRGECLHLQRYVGNLVCPLDLRQFPFDEQTLYIQLVSVLHSPAEVNLIVDELLTGRRDELSIVDWEIGAATYDLEPVQPRPGGIRMSGFRVAMPANRYANYYIFKVITPLVAILAMSWAVFWINPGQPGPRIGLAATSVLTMIAYRFMLGTLVPRVSYLTRLDIFIFGATIMVLLVLIEALISARLMQLEKQAIAIRLDRWASALASLGTVMLLWFAFG